LGTPTVNFEYGMPFGFTSSSFEKDRTSREEDEGATMRCLMCRIPERVMLPAEVREARRIMAGGKRLAGVHAGSL
jgi:hypothetical protein